MRIALFTEVFPPKIDGITNRLRHTLECFRAGGHEVRVFAPETAASEHAGAGVVRIPGLPFPPYPELRVSAPDPRIAWHLRRFRPDVVHAVAPACLGIWGALTARALGLPLVASHHTDLPRYAPRFGLGWARGALWPVLRAVHNRAHVNLAPSRFTRDEMRAHGILRVGLWRGGVDTQHFHPGRRSLPMRMLLSGGRPDGPILLYAGRLSPEKNLESLREILDAVPDARLALVGDGPGRTGLEEAFGSRPVVFTGFLRGLDLAEAFASADVFVMPSTTETLGFVVLEAMSSGIPVVAANAGGIPDLVRHGETGFLYDPGRPADATDAIRELVRFPGIWRYTARQARKAAEEATWQHETEGLLDAYRRAIAICGQGGGALARLHRALVR